MLSFGAVVACNNVLALKDFNTFLFNLEIHERPSWIEKKLVAWLKGWLSKKAMKQFEDLKAEVLPNTINLSLNDCSTGMFTTLYLAHQQNNVSMEAHKFKTANETLFKFGANAT